MAWNNSNCGCGNKQLVQSNNIVLTPNGSSNTSITISKHDPCLVIVNNIFDLPRPGDVQKIYYVKAKNWFYLYNANDGNYNGVDATFSDVEPINKPFDIINDHL